jgi:hypothetical protein
MTLTSCRIGTITDDIILFLELFNPMRTVITANLMLRQPKPTTDITGKLLQGQRSRLSNQAGKYSSRVVQNCAAAQAIAAPPLASQAPHNGSRQGVIVRCVVIGNCVGYISRAVRDAATSPGQPHIRARPYTPKTNGCQNGSKTTITRDSAVAYQ